MKLDSDWIQLICEPEKRKEKYIILMMIQLHINDKEFWNEKIKKKAPLCSSHYLLLYYFGIDN